MFLLILLVTRVATEWVEIAQTHYRKEPPRRLSNYKETTEANKIYTNYSNEQWHRSGNKFPNVGNVMRVQFPTKTGLSIQISPGDDQHTGLGNPHGHKNLGVRAPSIKRLHSTQTHDWEEAKKSTVRDEMRILFDETNAKNNAVNSFTSRPDIKRPVEKNDHKTSSTFQVSRVKTSMGSGEKETSNVHNQNNKRNSSITRVQIKPSFGEVERVELLKQHNNSYKIHETHLTSNNTDNKSKGKDNKTSGNKIFRKEENTEEQFSSAITNKSTNSAKLVEPANSQDESNTSAKNPNVVELANNANTNEDNVKKGAKVDHEKLHNKDFSRKTKQNNRDGVQNENEDLIKKTNTVEVIWKFMKVVADNISRNTRRSVRSKTRYLEDLRNNILANIEDRIDQAWPDDDPSRSRRRRSARGHVEFPSSESALMTISFLTFAVFLIKLVLQVIHTYKNKTMMVTPAVVAAVGRAAAALRDRKHN